MSFVYDELDATKRQIRLLRFCQRGDKLINVSLETVSLHERLDYHCLSYVWGGPDRVWPVLVNGVEVLVTKSLGEALQRLESNNDIHLLWTDALCINQSEDSDEKSHQVAMMGDIYQRAQAVYAWLGAAADLSDEIMDETERIGSMAIEELLKISIPPDLADHFDAAMGVSLHKGLLVAITWVQRMLDPNLRAAYGDYRPPSFWDKVDSESAIFQLPEESWSKFFSRPYWSRVWILQELAVAREVYLMCGSRTVTLAQLVILQTFLGYNQLILKNTPLFLKLMKIGGAISGAPILGHLADGHVGLTTRTEHKTMRKLLQKSGSMKTSIPQDRIFALLGLAADADQLGLEIDYKKPLHEYLEDVTRMDFIHHGLCLETLDKKSCPWASGTPSWVTRESNGQFDPSYLENVGFLFNALFHSTFQDRGYAELTENFQAGGGANISLSLLNFPSPGLLRLPCHLVGVVGRRGDLDVADTSPAPPGQNQQSDPNSISDDVYGTEDRNLFTSEELTGTISAILKLQALFRAQGDDLVGERHGIYQPWWLLVSGSKRLSNAPEDLYEMYMEALYMGHKYWCKEVANAMATVTGESLGESKSPTESEAIYGKFYAMAVATCCKGAALFETINGYKGLGSKLVETGDRIIIIPGAICPYVVREVQPSVFKLIGMSYVLGVMHGEFLETEPDPKPTWMMFC
jgi:hypothetical protein